MHSRPSVSGLLPLARSLDLSDPPEGYVGGRDKQLRGAHPKHSCPRLPPDLREHLQAVEEAG